MTRSRSLTAEWIVVQWRCLAMVFLLTAAAHTATCQSSGSESPTPYIEELLQLIDGEEARSDLYDLLTRLSVDPLDLNHATRAELEEVPFFDSFFIHNLLLQRSVEGGFVSVYDLKEVSGAPMEVLPLLTSYLTTTPLRDHTPPRRHHIISSVEMILQRSPRYPWGNSRPMHMWRYESTGAWSRWHISAKNDRGEAFRPISKGLYDFVGFAYQSRLPWNRSHGSWIIGDYRIDTGQGLLMGMQHSYFSAQGIISGGRITSNSYLRPHSSFRQYGYLRGIAIDLSLMSPVRLLVYAGYEPLDATVRRGQVGGVYRTNLHRTEQEIRRRASVRREVVGSYLSADYRGLHTGVHLMAYRHRSAQQLLLMPPALYPQRKQIVQYAIDLSYTTHSWAAAAEVRLDKKNRVAAQAVVRYYEERLGTVTLSGRYLAPKAYGPYAYPSSHTSTGRDEIGIVAAWHGEVAPWTTGSLSVECYDKVALPEGARIATKLALLYRRNHTNITTTLRYYPTSKGPSRIGLRSTVGSTSIPGLSLKLMGNISYTTSESVSTSIGFNGQYTSRSERMGIHGIVSYFSAQSNTIRASLPYMPAQYHAPTLRGRGLSAAASVRYDLSRRIRCRGRVQIHRYFRTPPQTPLDNLLELSIEVKI